MNHQNYVSAEILDFGRQRRCWTWETVHEHDSQRSFHSRLSTAWCVCRVTWKIYGDVCSGAHHVIIYYDCLDTNSGNPMVKLRKHSIIIEDPRFRSSGRLRYSHSPQSLLASQLRVSRLVPHSTTRTFILHLSQSLSRIRRPSRSTDLLLH